MTTRLEQMVDDYHEYLCDQPKPLPKRIPRPLPHEIGVLYLVETLHNRKVRVYAVNEDREDVSYRDMTLVAEGYEAPGTLALLADDVRISIDHYCDRLEFERDTSDAAMRAAHPREI